MNKKIKKQWLAALRSGRYRQGTGCLAEVVKGKTKYCCLGVLCQITKIAERKRDGALILFDGVEDILPEAVSNKCKIDIHGTLPRPVEYRGIKVRSLPDLNDRGMSFSELADIIEEQF